MKRHEVEEYLAKWYAHDAQDPGAPSRFRGVVDDMVDGCAGYTVMHTDRTGTRCTSFISADVTTAQLDDLMTGAG